MTTVPPPLPPALPPSLPPVAPPERSAVPIVLIVVGAALLVVFIVAALAGLAAPAMVRMKKKGDQMIAMNNGRMLAMMLTDFQAEYGSYPDRETAKQVSSRKKHGLDLSGDRANDYFRQLIAAGIAHSEDPFFATSAHAKHSPDNGTSGPGVLAPGEVGWGYVMDGDRSLPNTSPGIPLAVTPLLPGSSGKFDPKPYQSKALAIQADSSVGILHIQADGSATTATGKSLFETGPDTVWPAEVHPVIKPPAMRER